jgi:hypothetical protein
MARHPPPVEDHRICGGDVEGVVLVDVIDDADVVSVLFPATSSAAAATTAATMMTKMMMLQQLSHDDRARADGIVVRWMHLYNLLHNYINTFQPLKSNT